MLRAGARQSMHVTRHSPGPLPGPFHDHGRAAVMTTPRVTEMPLRLEPVQPDPFIDAPSRPRAVTPRLTEREERERRIELVCRVMHVHAAAGASRDGFRNARPTRATQRT